MAIVYLFSLLLLFFLLRSIPIVDMLPDKLYSNPADFSHIDEHDNNKEIRTTRFPPYILKSKASRLVIDRHWHCTLSSGLAHHNAIFIIRWRSIWIIRFFRVFLLPTTWGRETSHQVKSSSSSFLLDFLWRPCCCGLLLKGGKKLISRRRIRAQRRKMRRWWYRGVARLEAPEIYIRVEESRGRIGIIRAAAAGV